LEPFSNSPRGDTSTVLWLISTGFFLVYSLGPSENSCGVLLISPFSSASVA
jgi:hypothetical protein